MHAGKQPTTILTYQHIIPPSLAFEMDDGLEFQYASDDENEDVDEEVVVKNKRGKGKAWRPIVIYHNMVAAKASIRDDDTRVIGRINRGSTVALYYKCKFSSCGCQVQWRFITSQTSCEVVEEVNDLDHTCHDKLERNGGRGLSFDQVDIMELAVESRYIKPKAIILYFEKTARDLLNNG